MTEQIDFYYAPKNAGCSAVLITLKLLELPYNLITLDIEKSEHKTLEYGKLNPEFTFPTIKDTNGFSIWESRTIMTYLVEKYAKKDHILSSANSRKRATINQRLYFDLYLYQSFADCYYPIIEDKDVMSLRVFGAKIPPEDSLRKIDTAIGFLEQFLVGKEYAAGDEFTIADISLMTTMTFIQAVDHDFTRNLRVISWLKHIINKIPNYDELHGKTVEEFRAKYLEIVQT